MAKISLPYVKPRRTVAADGSVSYRPRFEPGPREVALGFRGRDLKHADGRWYSLAEAKAWADENREAIREARKSGRAEAPAASPGDTLDDLLRDYLASPDFRRLRPRTQRDYLGKAEAIRWQPQTPADRRQGRPKVAELIIGAPVRLIDPPTMKGFFDKLERERGLPMARGVMMVASAAFAWGRLSSRWKLKDNPCHRLKLPKLQGRKVTWSWEAVAAVRRAAAALGEHEISDAVWIGLVTAANPVDVLAFGAGLWGGRCRFVRSKTSAGISVPDYLMVDVLAGARARNERIAAAVKAAGGKPHKGDEIIIDHRTGRPFNEHTFRHRFAAVRALAAAGSAEHGLPPCPSAADVRFQDLRDTHFSWSHAAGNDLATVASVTGHKIATVTQMAEDHYLLVDEATADKAMDRFAAFVRAKEE